MIKKPYARYVSSVCLFLTKKTGKETFVLLQKRQNTGFADGWWEAGAAGHVDHGENMTQALVHEAKEELGIELKATDLQFACLNCKNVANYQFTTPQSKKDLAYYIAYFVCNKWKKTIKIGEPNKCSELKWFNIKHLPKQLIADRKQALVNYQKGIYYFNFNW